MGRGTVKAGNWELVRGYRANLVARNLTEVSVEELTATVWRFALEVHRPLLEARTRDIEGWLAALRVAPRTRRAYLSRIAGFYRWAVVTELLPVSPVDRIVRPRAPRGLPRPVRPADVEMAVRLADPRMRAWLLLAAFGGLRVMEIAGLTREDLFLDQVPEVMRVQGKGRKERVVPVHAEVLAALRAYGLPRAGHLFHHEGDPWRPLTPDYIGTTMGRYLRGCGIEASAHQLRHTFATEALRVCGDLSVVAELLGHSSTEVTAVYAEVDRSKVAGAVAGLRLGGSAPEERARV